jgi:signal transduction histidine kinase
VDLYGHRLELADSAWRAVTVIDRGGQPLAALLHDASLCDDPELIDAVTAAAGIALENAQLHAELHAWLDELNASTACVLEATVTERQRLERNLHDGAQQRLVALSLELSMLQKRFADDPEAKDRLEQVKREAADCLRELRELARGLHPAVVTDHGLAVALESLAGRSHVRMKLDVQLEDRLPEAIKALEVRAVRCLARRHVGERDAAAEQQGPRHRPRLPAPASQRPHVHDPLPDLPRPRQAVRL